MNNNWRFRNVWQVFSLDMKYKDGEKTKIQIDIAVKQPD